VVERLEVQWDERRGIRCCAGVGSEEGRRSAFFMKKKNDPLSQIGNQHSTSMQKGGPAVGLEGVYLRANRARSRRVGGGARTDRR